MNTTQQTKLYNAILAYISLYADKIWDNYLVDNFINRDIDDESLEMFFDDPTDSWTNGINEISIKQVDDNAGLMRDFNEMLNDLTQEYAECDTTVRYTVGGHYKYEYCNEALNDFFDTNYDLFLARFIDAGNVCFDKREAETIAAMHAIQEQRNQDAQDRYLDDMVHDDEVESWECEALV